jgi:hypothetical protein
LQGTEHHFVTGGDFVGFQPRRSIGGDQRGTDFFRPCSDIQPSDWTVRLHRHEADLRPSRTVPQSDSAILGAAEHISTLIDYGCPCNWPPVPQKRARHDRKIIRGDDPQREISRSGEENFGRGEKAKDRHISLVDDRVAFDLAVIAGGQGGDVSDPDAPILVACREKLPVRRDVKRWNCCGLACEPAMGEFVSLASVL